MARFVADASQSLGHCCVRNTFLDFHDTAIDELSRCRSKSCPPSLPSHALNSSRTDHSLAYSNPMTEMGSNVGRTFSVCRSIENSPSLRPEVSNNINFENNGPVQQRTRLSSAARPWTEQMRVVEQQMWPLKLQGPVGRQVPGNGAGDKILFEPCDRQEFRKGGH